MKKDKELIQCHRHEIVEAPNQNGESCKPFSLLEGEESFFSRIHSRDTSLGMSSRVYSRGEARVPFEWELQPGKPKVVEQNVAGDLLPPLSPPPAALFSYLSMGGSRWEKALVKDADADAARSNTLQWFWKRAGRRRQRTSAVRTDTDISETGPEYYSSFDQKAFVSSPTTSNASSSSSSSTCGSSLVYSRIKDARVHGIILRWVRRPCKAWRSLHFTHES